MINVPYVEVHELCVSEVSCVLGLHPGRAIKGVGLNDPVGFLHLMTFFMTIMIVNEMLTIWQHVFGQVNNGKLGIQVQTCQIGWMQRRIIGLYNESSF